MKIFPAIDLLGGKAVRLFKGDYNAVTVYSEHPEELAKVFEEAGAEQMHLVDLDGAKTGETPNLQTVKKIVASTRLFVEVGGGIRSKEVVETYLNAGVGRVILGTAAVTDRAFLKEMVDTYKEKIAVGVDSKDGFVAIKGWTEKSNIDAIAFCKELEELGVQTIICTDISKDGAMQGTNHELYKQLKEGLSLQIIASGGVSSMEDIQRLKACGVHGAIVGKAYYTGAVNLREAVEVAK